MYAKKTDSVSVTLFDTVCMECAEDTFGHFSPAFNASQVAGLGMDAHLGMPRAVPGEFAGQSLAEGGLPRARSDRLRAPYGPLPRSTERG